MQILDAEATITRDVDGLVLEKTQELTPDFLAWCQSVKDASHERATDYHLAVSVPTIFVEKWAREGFDIYRASLKDIRKRLHAEGLDAFDVSKKRL